MDWRVSGDLSKADRDRVYEWIAGQSYWAKEIPRETFDRSLDHSLCFVLKDREERARGFARVVTDRATIAYLCDVFVDETVRGGGGGIALINAVMAHPDLQGLRRFLLSTQDAHGLYARFGFVPIAHPERLMHRLATDPYADPGRAR